MKCSAAKKCLDKCNFLEEVLKLSLFGFALISNFHIVSEIKAFFLTERILSLLDKNGIFSSSFLP